MKCASGDCDNRFDRSDAYVMSKAVAGVSERYYCSPDCAFGEEVRSGGGD